uniref:Uncharacterized protein n=1 Tax=Rousettus aegyptiacus TaxID=9407 RepID=A0A7J8CI97_ROUAE|nr:hypothetical protein HJG63_009033 [Rousettus aegyptiacus]
MSGAGFRGWSTGARGAHRRRRTCLRNRNPKAGLAVNKVGTHCLLPLLSIQVGSKAGAGLSREPGSRRPRVGAPTGRTLLGGGSQHAEFRRSGPGAGWALRRLRTHCCRGKGFIAERLASHVALHAFYIGFAQTAELAGAPPESASRSCL